MQRIFNIEKWTTIPQGKRVEFAGDRPRRVNLELNADGSASIYLARDGKPTLFLARVTGRDSVEFYVDGSYSLAADGADVNVYTIDGDVFTFQDIDPDSFTVVRERRERNYELEYIAARMAENTNRRLEQQAHELSAAMERRMAAVAAQYEAKSVARDVPAPATPAADDGGQDAGAPDAGKRGRGRPPRASSPGDDG